MLRARSEGAAISAGYVENDGLDAVSLLIVVFMYMSCNRACVLAVGMRLFLFLLRYSSTYLLKVLLYLSLLNLVPTMCGVRVLAPILCR